VELVGRTALALEGLDGTDRDTVLVWGAGHLPGLAAGLRERGFLRRGDPDWHTVARLPWRTVSAGRKPSRDAVGTPT
jgi:hypothetical protein